MSPFSMNGLPSPGYQCPTSVYQPTPQQVFSLTQTGQQVPSCNLSRIFCFLCLLFNWCYLMKTVKHLRVFFFLFLSVQLVGITAMSLSTTKVFSHNLAWLRKSRSYSPSLSLSPSTPTGQFSLAFKNYKTSISPLKYL